jgi:hypothetical protein
VGIENPYAIPIAMAVATLYLFPAFLSLYSINDYSCDSTDTEEVREAFEDKPVKATETGPTAANPFMNVLISEIKYNPNRPPAADITKADMGDSLDSFFRVQWASDPTDVFGRTQSQRQFIAMPSTSIPNDQGSFMNWLYKIPGKTCKEGGKQACFPGTDGAVVPWLSNNR